MTAHDSALRELERRLRVIIGPFQAKGFTSPDRINTDDLFPGDEDGGGLDALVYETADHTSTVALNYAVRSNHADDVAYRGCYGERVPHDPAFQKIEAQVQAIATVLPPR